MIHYDASKCKQEDMNISARDQLNISQQMYTIKYTVSSYSHRMP